MINSHTSWQPLEAVIVGRAYSPDYFDFSEFDSLERFTGTHPNVMLDRIERKNWVIDLDVSKKKLSFKKFVLYYFEKWTGIRPFDFKNYKIIRS